MTTEGFRLRVWVAATIALLMSWALAGCEYETRFKEIVRPLSLSFAVSYSDGRSEITVYYSVPPPPPGKVYVLWAFSEGRAKVAKLGVVPWGVDRSAKGSADFMIQGVIITEEANGDVPRMEGTGIIELALYEENFGPSAGKGTPTPTPRR